MSSILDGIAPIRHEGTASTNPLAFCHGSGRQARFENLVRRNL
jgi:xylose isomerase